MMSPDFAPVDADVAAGAIENALFDLIAGLGVADPWDGEGREG